MTKYGDDVMSVFKRFFLVLCVFFLACMFIGFHVEHVYAETSGTDGTCSWVIDDNGVLTISPTDGVSGTLADSTGNGPWYSYWSRIKQVVVNPGVKAGTSCYRLFYYLFNCTEMDLSNLDTSNVTNMSSMFNGCDGLTSLDVSRFDTSNVTNMRYMFNGCSKLPSLEVSRFDTSNVTTMEAMFSSCSKLTSLDVSEFDTSKVTTMEDLFSGCKNLTSLDVSGFDTSKVTTMASMFQNCSGLTSLDLSGFDTGNVRSMYEMFSGCSSLTSLDVSKFDTSNVTDMCAMFNSCSKLTSLDVGRLDTSKVTNMESMFYNCSKLTSLDVSRFDTSNVTNMQEMFYNCKGLTSLDVSGFDTSNVTNMRSMFYNCSGLTSLDVSGFDTSKVTTMRAMFSSCIGLTSLDLSRFDTGNVTNMYCMFSGCKNLTSLDVSRFNTSKVTRMDYMLYDCTNLQEIDLGENFSFKGKNITSTPYQAILPTPPSETTTGKWIRDDKACGPHTPDELRDSYTSEMSGKWIWQLKNTASLIKFDANGGYTETQQVAQNNTNPVIFPNATRPAYYLTGWNTERDGNGTSYQPGDTYTPSGGETKTFYAQWAAMSRYVVNHYQQNMTKDGYDLVKTETCYAMPSATVDVPVLTFDGFRQPAQQSVTVDPGNGTVVDYYYDRTEYTITFNGNGADSGEIPDMQCVGGFNYRLLDNRFKKENNWFSGWNTEADGSGTSYGDAQTVTNLAGDGETITLYAQWVDISTSMAEPSEGKYTVQIRAGETITIPNLPAGTHYTIREVGNPDGWVQSGEVGTEGTIEASSTVNGTIQNSYSAKGSFRITAYKTMAVGDLSEGEFAFQLLEGTKVLQTKVNGSIDVEEYVLAPNGEDTIKNPYYGMSKVVFDDIEVDKTGTFTYTIREAAGSEGDIQYDIHDETVSVNVSDNHDGTLTCVVTYDSDGPVFTNSRIPVFDNPEEKGKIFVSKEVSNMENSVETFDFKVTLTDKAGTELTETYPYDLVRTEGRENYKSGGLVTKSAVSHTENLNDLGEKQSNYGNNWTNSNIRGTGRENADSKSHVVTIPGAESLHVSIVYGGESPNYDWICMWQGAHENYTAANNFSSSITGKLGGGNHTSTSNTKEYDVPGDSVTFSYRSDGGGSGDGYGYYAVITAEVDETEYDPKYYVSSGTITSGGTVQLASGHTAVINNMPIGVQYKVEELPKAGYEQVGAEGSEGSVQSGTTAEAKFTNVYSGEGNAQIQLTKQLLGGTLSGGEFTFELLDSDGGVIQRTANNSSGEIVFDPIHYTHTDAGNRFGYSVREVNDGQAGVIYDTHTETVVVEVSDNGDGTLATNISYEGNGVFTNMLTHDIVISKTDINGYEIGGAQLQITGRVNGGTSDIDPITWTSVEGVDQTVQLAPGSYILHESAAPDNGNYVIASDISFTVDAEGNVKVGDDSVDKVTMVDNYNTHEVVISKTDINGHEIGGAQLQITGKADSEDTNIEPITWTSVDGEDKTVELKPGTYVLHETAVPDEDVYVLASDITFVVDGNGNVTIGEDSVDKVTMVDTYAPHDVEVEKVTPNSVKITGANMRLTGRETGAETDITPISWTSNKNETKSISLKPGSYELSETSAPSGYVIADPVAFTVGTDGSVKVGNNTVTKISMTDAYDESGSLKITKTVKGEKADPEKQFDFVVTISDEAPDLNITNWKSNGEAVEVTKSELNDGKYKYEFTVSLKDSEEAEITGLHVGSDFTVAETELSARGYSSIATGQTGTIAKTVSMAAFTNHYLGVLPSTGFFEMGRSMKNIMLAIGVGIVWIVIALYKPRKKNEK